MRFTQFLLAAAGAALFAAAPASAQQQTIDGWDLNDDGGSCAISLSSEDGKALTMLNDAKVDALGFLVDDLTGVTSGKDETLQMQLGSSEWVDLSATGITLPNGGAGYMIAGFPISVFAEKPIQGVLRIRRGEEVIHSFPVDQLYRPAKAMVECGKKY